MVTHSQSCTTASATGLSVRIKQTIAALSLWAFSTGAYADISGMVFRDFNANGSFDNGGTLNEVGMAGVTVTAFDADDTLASPTATAVSANDGSYVLTELQSGTDYRLEFSWSESWLQPGASGGTTVQFAQDGSTTNNLALNSPEEYHQAVPQVATSNFLVGEPTAPEVTGKLAVVEFAYGSGATGRDFVVSGSSSEVLEEEVTDIAISASPDSQGTGNASPVSAGLSKTVNATMDQIGPVYGLAYHRQSNQLLASAFMKRFAGFPGGTNNTLLGTIHVIDRNANPNTVSSFFTANAGLDTHDYTTSDLGSPRGDTAAAANSSKSGWGDIDLSADGSVLYAINLFDKKIYSILVVDSGSGISAGTATTINFPAAVTSGLCSDDDWVPGGVKAYQGEVYVTVTCTAETSQETADLHHYVYKFPQGSNSPAFTLAADLPNYARQDGFFDNSWRPWLADSALLDGTQGDTNDPNRYTYPQPWLMDIEFDESGRIYLGMRNRTGDMRAAFNDAGQPAYEYGDTLIGTPDGDGTFTLLVNNNTGQSPPYELIDDNTTTGSEHPDNDMGALAILVGSGQVITPATVGNGIQGIRTYAVDAASVLAKSATPFSYYGLTQSTDVAAIGNPFGKVAGLGDLEILAAPAPVEIGNRVWLDLDEDGIQDADEAGLDGVSVALTCGVDTAFVSTSNSGEYLFTNAPGGNAVFMDYGESCQLSVNRAQSGLSAYVLTVQNAGGDTSNNAKEDVRDSDATDTTGIATIDVTVGNMGENNHTFDFGFINTPPPAVCNAGNGEFGGTVFRDYNESGERDLLEPGLAGVTITAYDADNNPIDTATSNALGAYVLANVVDGTDYRIEFTNLPADVRSGSQGTDSHTTVRFETAGARCDVDLGVNNPAQYCQVTPEITTSRFMQGNHATGSYSSDDVLISVNAGWGQYATGNDANPPAADLDFWQPAGMRPRSLAVMNQLGSTYGLAWSQNSNYLYAAAYQKSHTDFGPGGRGQVYRIEMNPLTGEAETAPEQWVNIETDLGVTVCGGHGVDLNGTYDQAVFDQVGKCSLGDLDISEDENTLFVMNLSTKEVVGIDTTTKAKTGQWAFPTNQASCTNAPNDVRPFALKYRNGKLYVGGVCSGETGRNKANLQAYVYSLDTVAGTWTPELEYDWSKQRKAWYGTQLDAWMTNIEQAHHGRFAQGTPKNWVTDNSQMLTDIEFVGNDMILGFRGRFADQWGVEIEYERAGANPVAKANYTANTVGDIVCAGYDAATSAYAWETNDHTNNLGVCGDRTASTSGYIHPDTDHDSGAADPKFHDDDLDDGEFYWGDGGAPSLGNARHYEVSMGGLAQYGTEPVIMSALTPPNALGVGYDQTAGFVWLDNNNGAPTSAYVVYDENDTGTFNKAAGLGDVEALCLPAPVEVGNRVWLDANENGIQDPGEAGVDGVDVTLSCGADTATVTTAGGGEYYFDNDPDGTANALFMDFGESCVVSIAAGQATLSAYELTTQNAEGDSSNDPATDLRDSDAADNNGVAEITFIVGNAGENNHTLDFGYKTAPQVDIDLTKTVNQTTANRGDTLIYTLTVRNTSATSATGVQAVDKLPAELNFVGATGDGIYTPADGLWDIGNLAPGASKTLTITVTIK